MFNTIHRVSNRMNLGISQSNQSGFESVDNTDLTHSYHVNNMEVCACCCMCMSSQMTYLYTRFPS